MQHNIPLIRAIHTAITDSPRSLAQAFYRHRDADGRVSMCTAGHAIELAGGYEWVGCQTDTFGAIQVRDLRTGTISFADDVARVLLGLIEDEAAYLFYNADNRQARAWLEDVLAADNSKRRDAGLVLT